ncbi:GTPase-binding protein rid1 [Fusarium oxysporum f. sp. albedinis]|nr:GTPase-binding protein rid1 [Fusarium oxysporum f. sp. albedinis]
MQASCQPRFAEVVYLENGLTAQAVAFSLFWLSYVMMLELVSGGCKSPDKLGLSGYILKEIRLKVTGRPMVLISHARIITSAQLSACKRTA